MAKMVLVRKGGDFEALGHKFGVDPLLIRLMINRGVDTEEKIQCYLKGGKESFHAPAQMKDMQKACEILLEKCKAGAKIRIMGDYDIDGVCSTTILLKSLQLTQARVDAVIPHRVRDGYGLNLSMIEKAKNDGIDTIITCDNGISAVEAIELARQYQMTVIVTDHHEVPFQEAENQRVSILPAADAIVDPKQQDCGYPFRDICGGYVAYKFMSLFFSVSYAGRLSVGQEIVARWNEIEPDLLILAAFATIGDIMPLTDENRVLVKLGLENMKQTNLPGLQALLDVCGLRGADLQAYHVGFQLGPCLNATGRIDTADRALDLFMETSRENCMQIAGDLKAMNDSRKVFTERGCQQADEMIEKNGYEQDKIMVLYLPDCHESVAGIIAGRVREKYERPVFVLTDAQSTEDEPVLKGSGRSVDAYDMYEAMTKVKDVFLKFGGHAQAAGFSIYKKDLEQMRQGLNQSCNLSMEDLQEKIKIDAEVPLAYISSALLDDLSKLEPFGNGNSKPVFARRNLRLRKVRLLGKDCNVGKISVADQDNKLYELTLFGAAENQGFKNFLQQKYGDTKISTAYTGNLAADDVLFTAVYYPKWNEFRGNKSIQLIMTYYS